MIHLLLVEHYFCLDFVTKDICSRQMREIVTNWVNSGR